MKSLLIILIIPAYCVLAQDCKKGENVTLEEGLVMKCKKGKWKLKGDRAAANPGAPPCEDNPSVSCAVQNGNCNQYTQKGIDMDRDCPGTCESCDGCRCRDNAQWYKFCYFWKPYCDKPGVLGTWMTTNCRKTCGKCRCKCCSYKGKQHALGARILLPEKCAELICEESVTAGASPLLSGAFKHPVSHPDELTFNFRVLYPGDECCILPKNASSDEGNIMNGTMVQEGWNGNIGRLSVTCCHGSLQVPLEDLSRRKPCIPSVSISGSVAFSIDNTGSVSSSAVGVKSLTNGILDELAGLNYTIPTWVLTTFSDGQPYSVSHAANTDLRIVTSDVAAFRASLNSIAFSGGGDGPERATQGILLTLQNLPTYGVALVFTDHQSKDLDLLEKIVKLKNEKKIQIFLVLAPKYYGVKDDQSWQAYEKISDGKIYNMADFSKDEFIAEVAQVIGNNC